MKTLNLFFTLLLMAGFFLPEIATGQTLTQTACGDLEVDAQITPASSAYVGGIQINCDNVFPDERWNAARISAFRYTLFRRNLSGGFDEVESRNLDASIVRFENQLPGEYFVNIEATTYSNVVVINTFSSCVPIGFIAGPSNSINTNRVFIAPPVPVANLEDSYCCEEEIILNTAGTENEEGYLISICQKDSPTSTNCVNWRSTGWIQGEVPLDVNLLDIWNNGGTSNWKFWTGNFYEVSLAVHNVCDSWEVDKSTFTVTRPVSSFEILDNNGSRIDDGGTICKSALPPVLDASSSSCGDAYYISICQFEESNPTECVNWRSAGGWIEGDVSQVGLIDLQNIWSLNGTNEWIFWSDNNYRVTLALKAECESWVSSSQSFYVAGNCLKGGGDTRSSESGVESFDAETSIQIYPTLLHSSSNRLNVVVDSEIANANVVLYDMLGREILQASVTKGNNEIALNNLGQGIYFATVFSKGQTIYQTKLVVNQ